MGRPPKIKKEEPESPNVILPLNTNNTPIATNSTAATTQIHDEEIVRNFGGIPRPNPMMPPPPNEQLYSSLYGREMELMRKMFKTDERIDNSMIHGANPGLQKGYPNYPTMFSMDTSNAKYFDTLPSPSQSRYDSLHNSNNNKLSIKPPPDPKMLLYPIGQPFSVAGNNHNIGNNRQPINHNNSNHTNSQITDDDDNVVHNDNNNSNNNADNKLHHHHHNNSHHLHHRVGLLKPMYDEKPFNLNFNNKSNESSLNHKSYAGFENSLSTTTTTTTDTTNHSLLLSESHFVSHNFNVNNYTNSDKEQFLKNNNQSPSDFGSGPNNSNNLRCSEYKSSDNLAGTASTGSINNNNSNNNSVIPDSAAKMLAKTSVQQQGSTGGGGSNISKIHQHQQLQLLTNIKHESRQFVDALHFDDDKSSRHSNNNSNDDDDDEFTSL